MSTSRCLISCREGYAAAGFDQDGLGDVSLVPGEISIMMTLVKRYGLAILGSLALWGLTVPAVQAQANWYDPFGTARQAAFSLSSKAVARTCAARAVPLPRLA